MLVEYRPNGGIFRQDAVKGYRHKKRGKSEPKSSNSG